MEVDDTCGLCAGDAETTEHIFLTCPTAVRCWELAHLPRWLEEVGPPHQADFNEWVAKLLTMADAEEVRQVVGVLWSIWAERNRRVWQRESRPEELVLKDGRELMGDWALARSTRLDHRAAERVPRCERWHPPELGMVKVNVDGAIFSETRQYGVGAVLRDSSGAFKGMMQRRFSGTLSPKEVEALALCEAIKWTSASGLHGVIFEVDCTMVSQAMCKEGGERDRTEFGRIIEECRRELRRLRSSTIVAVRRNSNRVAHAIARNSRYLARTYVGEGPPEWLVTVLDDICFITHD
ncbi:Putative ribonuclease H protein At1g65750 [Linum perenne]